MFPPSLLCSKDTATTTQKLLLFLFCGADSTHPLQGYDGYYLNSFCAPSYRGESLWHRVPALPAGLHICICSPQHTLTYRVARSLLSSRLSRAFSCSTDNSVSNMGLSSPPCSFFIPDCLVLAQHWAS